jgi:hypothetical protein
MYFLFQVIGYQHEKKAEQDTEFYLNVNEHLVSSSTCGTESQYDESRRMIENFF